MSTDNRILTVSYVAGADLSALQYQAVKMNTSGQIVPVTAITDLVFGILQNAPESGQVASVAVEGISNVVLGGTLNAGVAVGSGATGKAVADASTNYTLGILTEGGADTEIGSVLLNRATVK